MRWLSALAALVVACAPPAARATNSMDTGRIIAVIPVGAGPSAGLAADGDAIWVPTDFDGSLSRIDPLTNEVSATIRVGEAPSCSLCIGSVGLHEAAVWATSSSARLDLVGIDAQTNSVANRISLPVFPSAVLSDADGTLWIASILDSAVIRIDPQSQRVIARISVPRAARLASGDDAIWAISRPDTATSGSVVRIDRLTNRVVAQLDVGTQPIAIASGEGSIWVIDGGRQSLDQVDPRSNTLVGSVSVGVLPSGVLAADGAVWVVSQSAPSVNGPALLRIDPRAGATTGTVSLGSGTPVGLTAGAGSLWIASRNPDAVIRVDPFSSPSTGPHDLPWFLAVILGAALVAVGLGARWAACPGRSSPEQHGRQLSELQRFAARRRAS